MRSPRFPLLLGLGLLALGIIAPAPASASDLVGRVAGGASSVSFSMATTGEPLVVLGFRDRRLGRTRVCATPAPKTIGGIRLRYNCPPSIPAKSRPCRRPRKADRLPTRITKGFAPRICVRGSRTWLIQFWYRTGMGDFGGPVGKAAFELHLSTWTRDLTRVGAPARVNPAANRRPSAPTSLTQATTPILTGEAPFDGFPLLQVYPRWSKYSPGGYQGRLRGQHYFVISGAYRLGNVDIYGPARRSGNPTNEFGRNVYIDTYDSDYGKGWRRVTGALTQPKGGNWCYEFSPKPASKGKLGVSKSNRYRITIVGPRALPDQRYTFTAPPFPFGNADYNPRLDVWGVDFSEPQIAALKFQRSLIGPDYVTRARGTDCAKTIRQLNPKISAVERLDGETMRLIGTSLNQPTSIVVTPTGGEPIAVPVDGATVNTAGNRLTVAIPGGIPSTGTVSVTTQWESATGVF